MDICKFFEILLEYRKAVPNALIVLPGSVLDKAVLKSGSYAYCHRIQLWSPTSTETHELKVPRLDLYDYDRESPTCQPLAVKDLFVIFNNLINTISQSTLEKFTVWIPSNKRYNSVVQVGGISHIKLKEKIVILIDRPAISGVPALGELVNNKCS